MKSISERNVLKVLEGDCETAVGVHSKLKDERIILQQNFFTRWTSKFYESGSSDIKNSAELGLKLEKIKIKIR